ncbi:hypothetical protein WDL1P3_00009 (plasmid) [Variovorax sp. WDL1]|nr:hypothetical protein CHC06_07940 [Variovorax sp. B2]PNG46152.1 hypothetical protein CHC07_07900 [Variovorax sp. B4]VTV19057.1 hypothetical protein WDL1P3_00009 [Variovorax sp. WDL1]
MESFTRAVEIVLKENELRDAAGYRPVDMQYFEPLQHAAGLYPFDIVEAHSLACQDCCHRPPSSR